MWGKREMYHTVTNAYFAGRNRGRGSEHTVISQFAQKSEECIGLLDVSNTPERLSGSPARCPEEHSTGLGIHDDNNHPLTAFAWPVCPPRWRMWRCGPRTRCWLRLVLRHRENTSRLHFATQTLHRFWTQLRGLTSVTFQSGQMYVYTRDIQLAAARCVFQITHTKMSKVNLETTSQRYARTSDTLRLVGEKHHLHLILIPQQHCVEKCSAANSGAEREGCFQLLCIHSFIHHDSRCTTKETVQHTDKLLLECGLYLLRKSLLTFWSAAAQLIELQLQPQRLLLQ